jgi:hypothetical protein
MNSKRAKRLLVTARSRKSVKNGVFTADEVYLDLKKEFKKAKQKQSPKFKIGKRQQRIIKISREFAAELRKSNPEFRAIPGEQRNFAPKKKAHRV